jgi:hypothetical protein
MEKINFEAFQNEVIRPNIKLKNDFILSFFSEYSKSKKLIFDNDIDKRNKIEKLFKSDIYLKNILIGAIISNFDVAQLSEFQIYKSEYSKRIIQIIAKRLFDNID